MNSQAKDESILSDLFTAGIFHFAYVYIKLQHCNIFYQAMNILLKYIPHFTDSDRHKPSPKRRNYITLKFLQLSTECAYDYIYVYDGASSTKSKMLGSFSGRDALPTRPLLAESGSMLVVLFR